MIFSEYHHDNEFGATLRKLSYDLHLCRRSGSTRCHHRTDIQQLTEELIAKMDGFDWGTALIDRLMRAQGLIRINGVTTAICRDLELCLQKIRKLQRSKNSFCKLLSSVHDSA